MKIFGLYFGILTAVIANGYVITGYDTLIFSESEFFAHIRSLSLWTSWSIIVGLVVQNLRAWVWVAFIKRVNVRFNKTYITQFQFSN